jgi:hypothetical protein
MKTKESDSNIHESLYLVSFMNLNAIDAATICRTMDMTSAISFTITGQELLYKNRSYLTITLKGENKITAQRRNGATAQWFDNVISMFHFSIESLNNEVTCRDRSLQNIMEWCPNIFAIELLCRCAIAPFL